MDQAELTRALGALEESGARAFDAPSYDCARSLLDRAAHGGADLRAVLLERAAVHVQRLEARLQRARTRAVQLLSRVESAHGNLPNLRAAIARGEVVEARRTLRRLQGTPVRAEVRASAPERGAREYVAAAAELTGSFVVAEAVDTVPEHAGPYNSLRIATDLLACIGAVSPHYLTTQLTRLEELGRMLLLPELPASASPAPAAKPRKTRARRVPRAKS